MRSLSWHWSSKLDRSSVRSRIWCRSSTLIRSSVQTRSLRGRGRNGWNPAGQRPPGTAAACGQRSLVTSAVGGDRGDTAGRLYGHLRCQRDRRCLWFPVPRRAPSPLTCTMARARPPTSGMCRSSGSFWSRDGCWSCGGRRSGCGHRVGSRRSRRRGLWRGCPGTHEHRRSRWLGCQDRGACRLGSRHGRWAKASRGRRKCRSSIHPVRRKGHPRVLQGRRCNHCSL